MSEGYIKINRKILDWKWFKDPVTRAVFEYLVISANWHDAMYKNIAIKRGQALRSIKTIAEDNGITERQARTALTHLKTTGEVTSQATSEGTLITIENYSIYQGDVCESDKQSDKLSDKQVTSETAKSDKRATTYKNNNNKYNNKNNSLEREINKEKEGQAEQDAMLESNHNEWAKYKEALMRS